MDTKSLRIALFLAVVPVFALDEKPLLSQGSMEASLTGSVDGAFQMLDDSWGFLSAPTPSAPMKWGLEAGFKYGMNDQSDLEITFPWELRDADWAQMQGHEHSYYTGFDRLDLSAKIQVGKWGAGPLAGFSFPIGNTRVVGFEPEWGFTFGVWGGRHAANRWIDGLATWSVTPENSSGFKPGDRQHVVASAGIQLDEGVAPTFALRWDREGKASNSGKNTGVERQVFQAVPGCILLLDEDWTLETKLPVVFAGRNTFATAGLSIALVGSFEP